jgi:hypothetical protein
MVDASTGTHPNDIHDYVLEDDVSATTNTDELFEEQDEKENVEVESKITPLYDEVIFVFISRVFLNLFLISNWSWMLVWKSYFSPIQVTISLQ